MVSTAASEPEARRSARPLIVGAGVLIAIALAPLAVGLASAVVLYQLCARPFAWIARHVPPRLAAALTACAVILLVVGPVVLLGRHLWARLPAVRAALSGSRASLAGDSTGLVARLQGEISSAASTIADWLPGALASLGQHAAWALLNWSIALLGLYYLLTSGSESWPRFARLLPLTPRGAETLRTRFDDITQGIVAGTLLSAAVQGLSIGIGFWLAGFPDALFWGACAATATLVPVVGNAVVSIPALLIVIVRQNYAGAIAIMIFAGLLPPIIDRVVRATTSRRVGRVHPMITLVGAIAGARVAGIAGLVLGPVALATFFELVDVYDKEYVVEKPSYGTGAIP